MFGSILNKYTQVAAHMEIVLRSPSFTSENPYTVTKEQGGVKKGKGRDVWDSWLNQRESVFFLSEWCCRKMINSLLGKDMQLRN